MAKKLYIKIQDRLNEDIRTHLPNSLKEKFGDLEFETRYNFFGGGLMTTWSDGVDKETSKEIKLFIQGYEAASERAMSLVGEFK